MQIYLHKILPIFLLPTGLTLLLVVAGIIFRRRGLIWFGVVLLGLSSSPIISNFAVRAIEGGAERVLAINAPSADAVVVLSEGRVVAPGVAAVSEWVDADRFFGGVELFKANKAPLLVFTGGWSPREPSAKLEGEVLAEYAKNLGVPPQNIATTDLVTNTDEEAQAVAALLAEQHFASSDQGKLRHIILVTSAFHMRRAQRLFESAGLQVTPFPVDFKVSARRELTVLDFLPSAAALAQTEISWREIYGRLYYQLSSSR